MFIITEAMRKSKPDWNIVAGAALAGGAVGGVVGADIARKNVVAKIGSLVAAPNAPQFTRKLANVGGGAKAVGGNGMHGGAVVLANVAVAGAALPIIAATLIGGVVVGGIAVYCVKRYRARQIAKTA